MQSVASVYLIENKATGKVYVGVSKNFKRRIYQHLYLLKKGTHPNKDMQTDYNSLNPNEIETFFIFKELRKNISLKDIDEAEREYIEKYDAYNFGYNKKMASGYGYSDKLLRSKNKEMIKKLGRKLTVKECRENAGLTIEKMAKRMNISEVSYLTIEETGIFRNSIHMCYFSDLVDVSMSDVEHELKLLSLPIK